MPRSRSDHRSSTESARMGRCASGARPRREPKVRPTSGPAGRDDVARPASLAIFLQDLAGGGAERVMTQLAAGIAGRGLDVDLILVRREGPYLRDLPAGVRVVPLARGRTVTSIWPLVRYLRRERPNVLLSALVHVNIAAILAARLAGVGTRVVITEHNQISRNAARAGSALVWTAYRMVPRCYPLASGIIAVSDGVAKDLSDFSGISRDRIDVIHNPIVTAELFDRAKEPVDHPWFEMTGTPVIMGAGRLCEQKDFSTLIRGFAAVRAQRSAKLVIIGKGPERKELEDLIERLGLCEDVDMPGFVTNPYALLKRASLFVLSSAWEGLPTVLVEAMACGTPVVSTDCFSGPREILQGGRYGPLVPVGDPETLSRAMMKTLDAPPPAAAAVQRSMAFSLPHAVDEYLRVLFGNQMR